MPLYEYRCRTCATTFDRRRPMADADQPVTCPDGHRGAVRLLAVFATTGTATAPPTGAGCGAPVPGGCGGGCACHAG
jgi:putative FmdB family regulatory protein